LGDNPGNTTDWRSATLASIPGPPDSVAEVEPFDRVCKITHKVPAAELAIGGDFKSDFFLSCENSTNLLILEGL
jgi:hypothetical protein